MHSIVIHRSTDVTCLYLVDGGVVMSACQHLQTPSVGTGKAATYLRPTCMRLLEVTQVDPKVMMILQGRNKNNKNCLQMSPRQDMGHRSFCTRSPLNFCCASVTVANWAERATDVQPQCSLHYRHWWTCQLYPADHHLMLTFDVLIDSLID